MFDSDQDIIKELKKMHKGLKANHKKCMKMLDAGQNEIVDKPNANRNGPVGDQTTLDDIKGILLGIEQFLKSEKGQARIHELHKSRQAMARPEPIF